MHKRIGRWLWIKTNEGIARTQSPTNKNDAVELSTFEIIAGVNPTEVQWKGLALGEPPSWSWLTPQPGKYAHETDSLVDTIQFHSNVFGTLTQHIWIPPIIETVIPNRWDVHKYSITSRTSKSTIFETAIWFRTDLLAKLPKTFWASLQTSFPESALPILHLWSSTMENRVSTHRFNYSGVWMCPPMTNLARLFTGSFAQWRYSNQWSNREVLLLLVENYTQYPANSTWNTVVYGNFWRLLRKQIIDQVWGDFL